MHLQKHIGDIPNSVLLHPLETKDFFAYYVGQHREIAVLEQRMGKDHLDHPSSPHQSLQPQYWRYIQGCYF